MDKSDFFPLTVLYDAVSPFLSEVKTDSQFAYTYIPKKRLNPSSSVIVITNKLIARVFVAAIVICFLLAAFSHVLETLG